MQKNQQLPLEEFLGKTADEYIFRLENNMYAELILSDSVLIGAAVYSGSSPLDIQPVIY